MSSLLIQGCSFRKKSSEKQLPAIELYDGYFFRILKKAKREHKLDSEIDVLILSAKHGIIEPETRIAPYNKRMNTDRAEEIRDKVIRDITSKLDDKNYNEIIFNLGKDYLPAVKDIEDKIGRETDLKFIKGSGIGEKGSKLKKKVSKPHLKV